MSIYMKLPNISGSVQSKGYNGWIELIDADFGGVTNNLRMHVGKTADRCVGMPHFSQVSILKAMDKSSNALFQAVHEAQVFPKVEIHYVTTAEPLIAYSKLTLSNVMLSHYSENFSCGHSQPIELACLTYDKIERTFIPRDQNNKLSSPNTTGYDLGIAKRI